MKININAIMEDSLANGPGKRFTIWVQGCSIQCKDCFNKDTWSSEENELIEVDTLVKQIQEQDVNGITISGGEPLDQYESVLEFCKKTFKDYSIFLISGYKYDRIKKEKEEILKYLDIITTGPFIKSLEIKEFQYGGSTNQETLFLTERGLREEKELGTRKAEIYIDKKTGNRVYTGFMAHAINDFSKEPIILR